METNFDVIFSQLQKYVESQVNKNGIEDEPYAQVVNGGGSIPFAMPLDHNGNGHYETTQRGWGVTLSATVTINAPAGAVFDIVIHSNDGGGGNWRNIRTGEPFQCTLSTSFWHATTIKIDVHSSVPDVKLEAKIDYHY